MSQTLDALTCSYSNSIREFRSFIISKVMYDPLHSPDCNHLKLLTRYLSGILEMPTFREDAFYKDQCFAVEKFCTRAVELIKDTDLTSDDLENEPGQLASMDLDDIGRFYPRWRGDLDEEERGQ